MPVDIDTKQLFWVYRHKHDMGYTNLNYIVSICIYVLLLQIAGVFIAESKGFKKFNEEYVPVITVGVCTVIALYVIPPFIGIINFARLLGIKNSNIPGITLLIMFLCIISAIILYTVSIDEPNGKKAFQMRMAGICIFIITILVLLILISVSEIPPYIKRILIGAIVILAIGTPIYITERNQDIDHNLSMLVYGIGMTIFLSSIVVYNQYVRVNKCFRKYNV